MSLRRLTVLALFAAALTLPITAAGSPGFAIDGLKIKPPIGVYGAVVVGSCDLRTYAGCKVKTFTLHNVGAETIPIGGYGIFDLEPSTAALAPDDATRCSHLPLSGGFWALAPGASCTIGVAFTAVTTGWVENELHVWSTDQFRPIAVIPLFAVGIAGGRLDPSSTYSIGSRA
jgi:hypothetical protein